MASPARSRLSPRRRRLRAAWIITGAVVGVSIGIGLVVYFKTRPQQYRPDEQVAGIRSSLAQSLPADAPKPRFTDVTQSAGLADFRTFAGARTSQLPEDMGSGAAWGDYDNDGDDDLFLVSAGGSLTQPASTWPPCVLYENLGNGAFRRVTAFPEMHITGLAAAWGDYDGDGFLDLAITGYNVLRLLHNEQGTGRFIRNPKFPERKGFWAGAAWADMDHDRRLDLYVCQYVQYVENEADLTKASLQSGTAVPFTLNPSSYPGGTNALFHNLGDGAFRDVAAAVGVSNPEGRSLSALWHDFDDDGWLDLYVANDVSDNVFYRNTGGTFQDISHGAWVADYRGAMGLAAGDYNRDGDDDLFVTHWVAQENALYENQLADFATQPAQAPPVVPATRPATNAPAAYLRFMDIADMKGLGQIALPYVGWGTEFVDFDGDGWLDLVVANGSTIEQEGPQPRRLKAQECFLFWNRQGDSFYNLAPLNAALAKPHVSRGLAVSDYDNDGDMDILIVHLGGGAQLLRNDMQTGNWLKLRLRSRLPNGQPLGFGEGTTVIAYLGAVPLRRTVLGASYLSQSSRTLHFGLGHAPYVDHLEVRWQGGATNSFDRLEANATWEITEGQSAPKRIVPTGPAALSGATGKSVLATHNAPIPAARSATLPADKARVVEFWQKHRAAMQAMKADRDYPQAIRLFREALALNPRHEDAHYYLALCLADQGNTAEALRYLEQLKQINPHSHRAFQQWGRLRALTAANANDLAAAQQSLEQAHALNPEETGALLLLGEVALLRGDLAQSESQLAAACRSNPRAAGGFFLRGYLAWKRGATEQAGQLLRQARQALGPDWQPAGATSEGDVKRRQHVEASPLSRFWQQWDGAADPAKAFTALADYLRPHQ